MLVELDDRQRSVLTELAAAERNRLRVLMPIIGQVPQLGERNLCPWRARVELLETILTALNPPSE